MESFIFIDGEAGTTGIEIRNRLAGRTDIEILSLADDERKNLSKRKEVLNECDLAVLCLPDEAAKEAVSLINNNNVRVLDASSAHRTTPGWVYGLPEIGVSQENKIREAKRVSNPGCYPTGAIALLYPLISRGLIPSSFAAAICAVSGYSGAGKSMISKYEDIDSQDYTTVPYLAYALNLEHKHIEEMNVYSGLINRPIFLPAIGRYRQGILMQIPVHQGVLNNSARFENIQDALLSHYSESKYIFVNEDVSNAEALEPELLNGSNELMTSVFHNVTSQQIVLTAIYDNLGKGASGAAVQNLNLMLGLTEEGWLDLREADNTRARYCQRKIEKWVVG